jgi:hypothetical protein
MSGLNLDALLASRSQPVNGANAPSQVGNVDGFGHKVRIGRDGKPLPNTMVWVNVGYEREIANEDGTLEVVRITTPVGIALDTTPARALPSGNNPTKYRKIVEAQNALRTMLLNAALNDLKPGESKELSKLKVWLSRVNDEAPAVSADNPLLMSAEDLI